MNILKQSTAATIKLGPFIDDTDGKTAETGLTISQADIRLSKNGGDIAQTNNSTGATHDELGYYNVPLDTTDTNTLGRLKVMVHESGALPVWDEYLVVTANVYDTLCSTDSLDVNVTALADDVITAGKFDESTAYPLKSADTGSTQVARVGADSDTLETLSDEIAAVKAETAAILADTGTDGVVVASGQTVATVTNLTNLPTMPADWVTASGLKADAVTEIQSGLALEATLTAIKGTGWVSSDSLHQIKSYSDSIYTDLVNGGRLDLLIDSIIAHLVDIKGAGWTDETMVALMTALEAIPTAPLLASGYTAPDNAGIAAIKAKTDNLPADPADDSDIDAQLAAIKSVIDNVHDTDLPAVKAETALIIEDTGTTIPATLGTLATTAHVQEVEDKVDTADAVADAIKVKTDQLTFTVANKVDATATTDMSSIAGDVWSHATRTLTNQGVEATYPAEGDPLIIYRDTTVYITLTGIGATTGYTKIWFTVKEDLEDADTDAILQIDTTDKLKYIDGEAGTSTDGLLVIDSEEETADITLLQASAQLLPVYTAYPAFWDLKMLNDGVVSLLSTGKIYIYSTPTRSIA